MDAGKGAGVGTAGAGEETGMDAGVGVRGREFLKRAWRACGVCGACAKSASRMLELAVCCAVFRLLRLSGLRLDHIPVACDEDGLADDGVLAREGDPARRPQGEQRRGVSFGVD